MNKRELEKFIGKIVAEQVSKTPDPNSMSTEELQKQIDRYMEMVEKVYNEVGDGDLTEREMNFVYHYETKAAELEKILKSKLNSDDLNEQAKDPSKDDWDLYDEVEDIFSRHLGGIEKELDELADRFVELGFPEVADEIWSVLLPKVEDEMYGTFKSWKAALTYRDPFDDLK